jgi:hypothetical protein
MNEEICDFRFAICDLARSSTSASLKTIALSLTPCFSGVYETRRARNRFSGFECAEKTAEAVNSHHETDLTLLKQGVNESGGFPKRIGLGNSWPHNGYVSCPLWWALSNRKSQI